MQVVTPFRLRAVAPLRAVNYAPSECMVWTSGQRIFRPCRRRVYHQNKPELPARDFHNFITQPLLRKGSEPPQMLSCCRPTGPDWWRHSFSRSRFRLLRRSSIHFPVSGPPAADAAPEGPAPDFSQTVRDVFRQQHRIGRFSQQRDASGFVFFNGLFACTLSVSGIMINPPFTRSPVRGFPPVP